MLRWFFGLSLHMRIAIILAPLLSIGGYGMMDLWMNKDAPKKENHVAMQQLLVEGQCLLATNQCKLKHDAMQVSMTRVDAGKTGVVRLEITPSVHIRGAQMALVQAGVEHQVVGEPMKNGEGWFAEFPESLLNPSPSALRIALAQFGRVSFAEIPAQF